MTKKTSTKKALLASILSLMTCVAMFVGSTFAWFTDSDTVNVQNIVAGNLDIEIVDEDGNEKTTALAFVGAPTYWEPGQTFSTEKFALKNNGNIALKFKLEVNNTEVSYNKLNEKLTFSLVDASNKAVALSTMRDIELAAGASTQLYTIQCAFAADASVEYMNLSLTGVCITVYATQVSDDAMYDDEIVTVNNADQFIAAFAKLEPDQTITLTDNIDLTGKTWTPVNNKSFTLDGNGKTITGMNGPLVGTTAALSYTVKDVTFKNLTVDGEYGDISIGGIIGYADTCSYINMENVTIDTATVTGAEYVGGFVGYTSGYGVDTNGPVNASHNFTNCTIKNATLTSTSDGSTGGLIGHAGSNAATTTRISGFAYENLTLAQATTRTDKLGYMIGTANIGIIYIADAITLENSAEIGYIGRFVPGDTGKLIINGQEIAAFDGKGA